MKHDHPEVLNWVRLLAEATAPSTFSNFLMQWEKTIFSFIVVFLISFLAMVVSKHLKLIPGRSQTITEFLICGLDDMVCGVLGPQGRAYTPFLGSLFIYILTANIFGLIPLQSSSMAFFTTTVPLAICVFLYVQWVGITRNGFLGYLYHLCGSPKDFFGWAMVVLQLPLHIFSELIKPLTLSVRLYGNIMAGHILLAVIMMLGVQMLKPLHIPAGVPLHFPFLFLEILVGLVQAFVFTLLPTIYIAMMLPHGEEDHKKSGTHEIKTAHG